MQRYGKNLFYFFNASCSSVKKNGSSSNGGSSSTTSAMSDDDVVMHVHFGMSGAFKLFELDTPSSPSATATTRLRLEQMPSAAAGAPSAPASGAVPSGASAASAASGSSLAPFGSQQQYLLGAHLSAMTVEHGGLDLYHAKVAALGEDPLRNDADPDKLWLKIAKSKKSIGVSLNQFTFASTRNM